MLYPHKKKKPNKTLDSDSDDSDNENEAEKPNLKDGTVDSDSGIIFSDMLANIEY